MELESSGTGHNALLETNSASLDNEEYTLCNKLERVAQCRHTGPDCSCSAAYQRCAGQVLQESKVPLIPVHSDSRVPLGGPQSAQRPWRPHQTAQHNAGNRVEHHAGCSNPPEPVCPRFEQFILSSASTSIKN